MGELAEPFDMTLPAEDFRRLWEDNFERLDAVLDSLKTMDPELDPEKE